MPSRGRKAAWATAALVTVSSVAGLGLAELATRMLVREPVYSTTAVVYEGFYRQLGAGWFVADERLGFRPGPRWRGTAGRLGFQNGAHYGDLDEPRIDVALLGDSVIQSRDLARALRARLAERGVRVWNAGIGGYNTVQEAEYLERFVRLRPDALVLGFCLNDFLPSMTVVAHGAGRRMAQQAFEPIGTVSPFWFRRSALYRLVRLRGIELRRGGLWSPETVKRQTGAVREALARIARWARERDAALLVLVYPHLVAEDAYLRAARLRALAILEALAIPHVDLAADYAALGLDLAALRRTPDDVVHPNADGHEVAARAVVRRLGPVLGLTPSEIERLARRP